MSASEDFEALYLLSRDRLAAQVFALTGSRVEAAAAVQEAWTRAWERWVVVGNYHDPEAWVRQVAYRVAVSRWRRLRRMAFSPLAGSVGDDERALDSIGTSAALVGALRQPPCRQQQALVLHYLAGLPVADVAAELGVPLGTAKSLLSRGRRRLAAVLGRQDSDDPEEAIPT